VNAVAIIAIFEMLVQTRERIFCSREEPTIWIVDGVHSFRPTPNARSCGHFCLRSVVEVRATVGQGQMRLAASGLQ
jgi:hypothetical protein